MLGRYVFMTVSILLLSMALAYAEKFNGNIYEEETIEVAKGIEFLVLVNKKANRVEYIWQDKWIRPENQSYWQKLYDQASQAEYEQALEAEKNTREEIDTRQ